MNKKITTVLIDIDDTLLDFNKCSVSSIKEACKLWDIQYSEKVYSVFTEVNDSLWDDFEKNQITRAKLHEIRWQIIFDRLGIKKDGKAFDKLYFDILSDSREKVEGADELLKYLSDKFDVYAASNAGFNQQINRLTKSGFMKYLKGVFISEKIGFAKPSKEFFDVCSSNLTGVKKEETLLIGDSLTADIKGAVEYGLTSIWLNRKHIENASGIIPDFTVYNLKEIEKII